MKTTNLLPRLARAGDGATAIEFAFLGTALLWLALGVLDFGMLFWDQMQVAIAAQAGADYAGANSTAYTGTPPAIPTTYSTNITSAVTGATNLATIAATPAPSALCGCPTAAGGVQSFTCQASCSGGGTAGTYIVVNATGSYTPLFPWAGSGPISLTSTAFVQIR
jgi:Flp pilus assembly protein TadG